MVFKKGHIVSEDMRKARMIEKCARCKNPLIGKFKLLGIPDYSKPKKVCLSCYHDAQNRNKLKVEDL